MAGATAVARRCQESHPGGRWGCVKYAVVGCFTGELAAAPTHRDGHHARPRLRADVARRSNRSLNELLLASTSRIFAPGAMAWAHSTSRAISVIQPALAAGKLTCRRLVDLREGRVRQPECRVELLQVAGNVRIVVGIDNGNRGVPLPAREPLPMVILLKP